jgi:hypothetical protein
MRYAHIHCHRVVASPTVRHAMPDHAHAPETAEASRPRLATFRTGMSVLRLGVYATRASLGTVLVVVALAMASLATLASSSVSPALAYDQSYNCASFVGQSTCNQTAGSWYSITNVGATNWSVGGDICDAWGNLKSSTETCYSSGSGQTILECSTTGALYGYGWAGTYWGDDWNISGHEDNYSSCS